MQMFVGLPVPTKSLFVFMQQDIWGHEKGKQGTSSNNIWRCESTNMQPATWKINEHKKVDISNNW